MNAIAWTAQQITGPRRRPRPFQGKPVADLYGSVVKAEALRVLREHGAMSATEFAGAIGYSYGGAVKVLYRLADDGAAVRREVPGGKSNAVMYEAA